MNQRAIIHIILAVIGIPVLITIGVWSATDPILAGASALIVVGIIVITQLGTKIWLLIPFFASFRASLNILPGHFAPRDLVVGLVAVILPALWVVRRFPIRVRIGSIEIALLVLLAFLGQAFLRNPVGLSIFGSGVIGGRPYFEIVVAVVAFAILSIQVVDFKSVRMMVFANFVGSIFNAIYGAVLGLFPGLALYAGSVYSGGISSASLSDHLDGGADPNQGAGRMTFLKPFGDPITILVLSFKTPLQLLNPRNFGFLFLIVFAGVCVLLSGFRSEIVSLGLLVIAASFLHRKPIQIIIMGAIGVPLFAAILVLQGSLFELPLPAQRALSFMPADWNQRAVSDAEGSSDWRFEMWEEALTSDRYIRNKWLGDGFGFTAREMAYQQELMVRGVKEVDQQEYFLMIGTYHSGPIETIKRIGYLGLVFFLIFMGVLFKESVSLVNRTRGTPYFPYAMFIALPLVIHPFVFVFIFGAFKYSLTALLLGGGGLRLVGNSFEAWRRKRGPVAEGSTTSA